MSALQLMRNDFDRPKPAALDEQAILNNEIQKQLLVTFYIKNGKYVAETKEQYIYLSLLSMVNNSGLQAKVQLLLLDDMLANAEKIFGPTNCKVEKLDPNRPLY